jgi:citrate lyase subunit beta / citryl-CoA lyase
VGEQLVTVRTKRGFAKLEWQKLRERNEALDCRVYARAAAWIADADRWPDEKWRDLEDAVGPDDKDAARENVAHWFSNGGTGVVRINGTDTAWISADLEAIKDLPGIEVMVPKASPESLVQVGQALPQRPLIALIESVEGLVRLHEAAARPGVARLAFGNLDFSTDARIPGTGGELDQVRLQLVLASRHAGLPPPIDGVTAGFRDEAEHASDIRQARSLGFTAKLCIHPRQIAAVNAGFAPRADEMDWARRVVAALADSRNGVVHSVTLHSEPGAT